VNSTIIYLRTKSTQSSTEPSALPRKGTPIGAIAYTVEDNILEVAYALQNPKDTWDRERSRRIVTQRLELKRETCTKQQRTNDGTFEAETVPKYFRLELDAPILDTEEGPSTRPYDILNLIVEAARNERIAVPERLIKTIVRMQADNEVRVQKLSELAAARHVHIGAVPAIEDIAAATAVAVSQ